MIIIRWLITTIAVWVAVELVPGLDYDRWQALVLAALVLGILNTFVKPILAFISIPLIIVTLGIFLVAINAALLKLTAWLVPGFTVADWLSAFAGSVIISIVSFFFGGSHLYRSWRSPDYE
jgi:putative membrane protein